MYERFCTLVHIYTFWYYVYFSRCDLKSIYSELLYFYAILLYLAYGFTFWCSICPSRCVLKIYLSIKTHLLGQMEHRKVVPEAKVLTKIDRILSEVHCY